MALIPRARAKEVAKSRRRICVDRSKEANRAAASPTRASVARGRKVVAMAVLVHCNWTNHGQEHMDSMGKGV